jgi:lipoprotein NlpD
LSSNSRFVDTKVYFNKRHYGVDISTSPNESVVAVIDGNVIFSGYTIDEGYVIALQHDENFVSFYKHNSVLLKKAGDFVKSGESIAIVGNTGEGTTVNHLHFELWKDGKPQNPQDYIIF